MSAITSWSHSSLSIFEQCKYRSYQLRVEKVPEPERPLPPGKSEHANDRGSRVHDNCEAYVRGQTDALCNEASKHFGPQIDLLRVLYAKGMVSLEGEWGMDLQWAPADWKKAWHRSKLDFIIHLSDTEALIGDYKTGRKFGNEVKHAEQMQLYQLNAFLRFPKLETVTCELWYLDQDEVSRQTFTRAQGLRFKSNFERRGKAMTSCTTFPPNPNIYTCQYCAFGPWEGGTGHCQVGVKKKK